MFRKSGYDLMNRVTASSNSFVTAIVSSDAYQLSILMDKWESMNRVTASSNSFVTAIVSSDAYQLSILMDKWESMLYV